MLELHYRPPFQIGDCNFCMIAIYEDGSHSFPFQNRFESFHEDMKMCAFCQAFALYSTSEVKMTTKRIDLTDQIEVELSFDAADWVQIVPYLKDDIMSAAIIL